MNLFIDTNVLLSFYHMSSDDLEELRKLSVLLKKNKVTLHLPSQVEDEFRRNRDSKIADAINKFSEQKLNKQFPQICKNYTEYALMRDAIKSFEEHKSKLLSKLNKGISTQNLKADKIIAELFTQARKINVTPEILEQAKTRFDLGNPPGKKNSYGDAVNWECLLHKVADDEDLYFISDDNDYCSELDPNEFSSFLKHEWKTKNGGEIIFFNRLSAFFRTKFSDIKLASELEKELVIRDLASSPNFLTTRKVVNELKTFTDFTAAQLNDIVSAAIKNNQVRWIIEDMDINQYFTELVATHPDEIEKKNLAKLEKLLNGDSDDNNEEPPPEPDDVPF